MLYERSVTVGFRLRVFDNPSRSLEKARNGHVVGYEARTARIGPGAVHLVARAKLDGLMADISAAALWQELSGDRFTTPLLRCWTPWLRQRLIEEELLVEADGHNCSAGLLSATPEELDKLVADGVRLGNLNLQGV